MFHECLMTYLTDGCVNCPRLYLETNECYRAEIEKVYPLPSTIPTSPILPDEIFLATSTGDIIIMTATSKTSYDKIYYRNGEPRRVKHVDLPINYAGTNFPNTFSWFDYLRRYQGYKNYINQ